MGMLTSRRRNENKSPELKVPEENKNSELKVPEEKKEGAKNVKRGTKKEDAK